MSVYTGKGDKGQTEHLNKQSVSKNDISLYCIGAIDELNSHIGLVKAMLSNVDSWQVSWLSACNFIEKIQKNLIKVMAHISDSKNDKYFLEEKEILFLEKEIDRLTANLPKLADFIIPGKNIIEAQIQIARTITRRAERLFFAVNEKSALCPQIGIYLNRLSDYLFVLSQQESLINVNFINEFTGI
ncbi:MAG: cob(I)yrinic acid a,c-diamide adenosyltransferase [Treponema sp.]|nr:cob(I)yrinic acid a,c-diamide adenosyltransferase [Treponema sp.]